MTRKPTQPLPRPRPPLPHPPPKQQIPPPHPSSFSAHVPTRLSAIPVVLVGETYWRRAGDIDFLVDEGVIDPEDRDLFWFAETAQEIWNGILQWHDASGEPLQAAT